VTRANLANRKGDYHRYLAEFASGPKRKGAATAAHEAYKVIPLLIMHLRLFYMLRSTVADCITERHRRCPVRAHPHSPYPPGSRPELLRFLLRDPQLA
jgi:hypothetical protein